MERHSISQPQPVFVQPSESNEVYTFNNHWHSSLFGSLKPCYRTAFACFCCSCYTAKVADRAGEHFLTCCINPCSLMALRTKIRTAFHIHGSLIEDCYTTICCGCPCAIMQIEKELDHQSIPSKSAKKI